MFHIVFRILLLVILSFSGLITSVYQGRESHVSAVVYLLLFGFYSEVFPLSLGALDRLHYYIVALPGPSI